LLVLEKNNQLGLPDGWYEILFSESITNIPLTGYKLKQKDYQEKGKLPVIDQGQEYIGGYTDRINLQVNCELPIIIFGDHTKSVKFVNNNFVAGADGIKVLKPKSFFDPKLFYYFTKAIKLPEKGYARHYQFLEKSFIRIPPLNEQKRIVAKIEELFSEIEHISESLKIIKDKIEYYRRSLLVTSFQNLSQKELLSECAEIGTGGTPSRKKPEYYNGKIPWVKTTEIKNSHIENTDEKITQLGLDNSNAKIYPKNSVILAMYGEGKTRGRVAILDISASTNQACAVMVCNPKKLFYKYCFYWFQSQYYEIRAKSSGGNQPNLNLGIIKKLEIPLTDMINQEKIVAQIELELSQIEFFRKNITQTFLKTDLIRNSILKQAFEGKLVTQDPNDEPAEVLLQKIKREKQKISN